MNNQTDPLSENLSQRPVTTALKFDESDEGIRQVNGDPLSQEEWRICWALSANNNAVCQTIYKLRASVTELLDILCGRADNQAEIIKKARAALEGKE
jgi:hypothetical protein